MLAELLQQLPLGFDLIRSTAFVRLLQVDHAVVTHLSATVNQPPLGIQNGRLRLARVKPGNRQQDLHVWRKPRSGRGQHDSLTVQPPRQLAYQQLINVCRQAACPTTISGSTQAAIGLALQQGFTLQVVSQRHRAKQYGHASTLRRLARAATVQLIQGRWLMHAAPRQAKHTSQQHN